MPILDREVELFPADLLARPDLGGEPGLCWWALYTISRREKDLMRRLCHLDVPFYSPLVAKRHRSRTGRVRVSRILLFPGYVFIYGDESHRYLALTTNCVSRCLDVPDGVQLTRDLRQIQHLIGTDVPLTPEAKLQPGMPVRILSGPLAGLEGVVIRREKETRLLVAVDFLQQGASVLLDDCQLERLA